MSDLFQPGVPSDFVADVFDAMADAPQHVFQVLTKRPAVMASLLSRIRSTPLPHVWLGTSIETDQYVWRADKLRETPAAVRFLSLEPLLGPLPSLELEGIDWVIVGGESGHGARGLDLGWVRHIRDMASDSGAAFFFKQTGSVLAKQAGTRGKGGDPAEWPADVRVREYPASVLA